MSPLQAVVYIQDRKITPQTVHIDTDKTFKRGLTNTCNTGEGINKHM